jgi:hypothetical protein
MLASVATDTAIWITAIATVVMALATIALASIANTQLGHLVEQGKEAQARQIAVVPRYWSYSSSGVSEAHVYVYNGSNLPIYDCNLELLPWRWRDPGVAHLDSCRFACVPPGDTEDVQVDEGLVRPPATARGSNPPYRITFRDAGGTRWRRDPDGQLTKLN